MAGETRAKGGVAAFGGGIAPDDEDEMPLDLDVPDDADEAGERLTGTDLAGKHKAILVVGEGNRGKTTLARVILEWQTIAGTAGLAAALDPRNRTLAQFFNGVVQPGTVDPASGRFIPTFDPPKIARWLEDFFLHLMKHPQNAVLDFGGGDASLMALARAVPDLIEQLRAHGIEVVLLNLLGPREADLTTLAALNRIGFQPHTALIRNEGVADPTLDRKAAFARVMRHSAFRAAVERGALPLWMPRLDAACAQEIEAKRLHFTQARDAVEPEGRKVVPLGPFNRARVRIFLDAAARNFEPIKTWLR